jgi:hypothetical protein
LSIAVAVLVIAGVTAVATTIALLLRRRAPEGGWFGADMGPGTSIYFAVLTGFVIPVGFVVSILYQSYNRARVSAEQEAVAVARQAEAAAAFPNPFRETLQGQLLCYGRTVVHQEWPAMADGHSSPTVELWIRRLVENGPGLGEQDIFSSSAVDQWVAQSNVREEGRRERLLEANSPLPTPLWVLLGITAGVFLVYPVLFVRRRQPGLVTTAVVGGNAVVVTCVMLALVLLATPYGTGSGAIKPAGMEYTLARFAAELPDLRAPCNEQGFPANA